MRRVVWTVVVLAIIAAGAYALLTLPVNNIAMPPLVAQYEDSALAPAIAPAMPAGAQPATVNYVHDGDTLFLTTPTDANLKVRLLAVDTPEVGDHLECLGDEATAYLRTLAPEGSTVYTLADLEPLDKYGRSLLFVWTPSGELINYSLVANGYAEAVFIGTNRLYEVEVESAEDAAQAAGLGIWGAC